MQRRFIPAIPLFLALFAAAAPAAVYRVGPGEEYATVSQIAEALEPGDVVEVTGDITDSFTLTRHGAEKTGKGREECKRAHLSPRLDGGLR